MKESTSKIICAALLVLIACVNIATFEISRPLLRLSAPVKSTLVTVEGNFISANKSDEDSVAAKAEKHAAADAPAEGKESTAPPTPTVAESSAIDENSTSCTGTAENAPPSYCSYCGSQAHSYGQCARRFFDNGAVGRWIVPCVGIDVACYYSSGSSVEYKQSIVDDPDGAAYYNYNNFDIIADHSNQDFSALKNIHVGDMAYMDKGSYQQKYICTKFEYGHNDGKYLLDENYNAIGYMDDYNPGGITCYTCNGNWRNIILVSFQPVNN